MIIYATLLTITHLSQKFLNTLKFSNLEMQNERYINIFLKKRNEKRKKKKGKAGLFSLPGKIENRLVKCLSKEHPSKNNYAKANQNQMKPSGNHLQTIQKQINDGKAFIFPNLARGVRFRDEQDDDNREVIYQTENKRLS